MGGTTSAGGKTSTGGTIGAAGKSGTGGTAPGTCGTTSLKYSPDTDITGQCCSVDGSTNTVYKQYVIPGQSEFVGMYKCLAQ